jgi:hypothetical protein
MGVIRPEHKSSNEYTYSGEIALDGSNPTPVQTPFSVITSVSLAIKGTAAPGLGTSVLTYNVTAGLLDIYAWKPSTGDPTLAASTGTETVSYQVTGY